MKKQQKPEIFQKISKDYARNLNFQKPILKGIMVIFILDCKSSENQKTKKPMSQNLRVLAKNQLGFEILRKPLGFP